MSSDLIGMSYSTDSTSLSSLTSTSTSSSASTLASSLSSSSSSKSTDATEFSQGGQSMQELKELASSDPEKFKEVAQQISDKLTEAAGNSTDSKAAKMMTEMAGQFATAASSGSMSSFSMPEPPTGSGAQGQAAAQYAKQSGTNPMEQVDGIISDALSGVGSTSA